jgi:tetratricopeptide (TPR) repeat protein
VGLGDVAVAAWRLGFVQDAKDIFIDATGAKAEGEVALETLSDFGYLFVEKYNATDAISVFRDCLKINKAYPDALVGIALAKRLENSSGDETYAKTALVINPNLVPAIALLAQLRIEEEDFDSALKLADRAVSVNPASLEALSVQAVCRLFRGDLEDFRTIEQAVLRINPRYGRLYHTIAENLVMRRKYREAVDQDRHALQLDQKLWPAHASLGMNLMRIGDLAGGRTELQKAFEGDPFNIWAFNTLDLLDQMDKFVRTKSAHFVYLMAQEDEASLSQYAPKIAEEAYDRMTARYGFKPAGPLQVEIFPDHGGFAVRTLGLPGLGALGVCFGKVVAIDSPRARKAESFNWGSTLWHELAHVITLQMTDHNIPRWYSEGLSVYEEHRARPGWGDDLTVAFVKAYKQGTLLKVGDLNVGMMRPKSPEQIGLSYYQAALFCELIEEKFGFEKIRETLRLFAKNKGAQEVFREALGWDPTTLESEYRQFLEVRLRSLAEHFDFTQSMGEAPHATSMDTKALADGLARKPDDFMLNLQMGVRMHEAKSNAEAETYLKKAESLFPEFAGRESPYQILGDLYIGEGRDEDALAQYLGWTRYDETAALPLVRAAEIYRKKRDWVSAARMLELSVYVQPYGPQTYIMLGEAAGAAGDWPAAKSAYQVLVGLNPPDPAGAHYSLALSWLALGKSVEAKREVLRALEIAPSFEKAQKMLLTLSGSEP